MLLSEQTGVSEGTVRSGGLAGKGPPDKDDEDGDAGQGAVFEENAERVPDSATRGKTL